MATLNTSSSFISYNLTEDELLVGSILTALHRQCIQNQISAAAESRLALTLDPINPMSSVQAEAELQGRILALKYLLELSDNAEQQLKLSAQNNQLGN